MELDFGSDVFDGFGNWLEIGVRSGHLEDPNEYTILSPRQKVTPTPYALQTCGSFVDSAGNIGIGTNNPTAKLDIINPSSGPAIAVGRSLGYPSIVARSDASSGWLIMDSTGAGNVGLNLYDDGDVIMVYGGGNVDIGTVSPTAKLDIANPSSEPAISVGRSVGNPSIVASSVASDGWLMMDSTGDGSVGLNQYDDGNVIMAYGGGNVGIGTVSPAAKLDIANPSSGIAIAVGRSHGNPSIVARSDAFGGWLVMDSTGDGSVGLNQYDDGNVIMAYGGGNVGIGMAIPAAKLDIASPSSGLAIVVGCSPNSPSIVARSDAHDGWLVMDSTGDGSVRLNQYDDGNVIMVYGGGNVGIGTDSPTVKLEVNGTVKATRLVGDGSGLTGGLPDEDWIVSEPNIMYRESGNVGIGTTSPTAKLEVSGGIINDFAIYRNELPSGTDGGVFTPGSWTTRTLNTTLDEYGTSISRSGSQITLAAGTYYVEARAPAYHVNRHKAMLYNVTDAQNALIGSSAYSDYESDDAQTDSVIRGTITISGTKTFEVRHRAQMNGKGGLASNFGVVEIYTEIYIRKLR